MKLSNKKTKKVDALVDDAKDASAASDDTQIQLSNNLISVTLSFVALLATAISVSNILTTISSSQKIIILLSIIVFCISIFVGLTNFYLNMRFHQKTAKASRKKAERADSVKDAAELNEIERVAMIERAAKSVKRSNALIVVQVILLAIGLSLCVVFIGTLLFHTSESI